MRIPKSLKNWYMLLVALVTAWSLRNFIFGGIEPLILTVLGYASLLFVLSIVLSSRWRRLYWDEERNLLTILRPWGKEIIGMCLIKTVPQGIDLSHNAKRVLSSMAVRLSKVNNAVVDFIVCRPLRDGPTRIGFMITRKQDAIQSLRKGIEKLVDKVYEDVMVLESAMRAAYPHTPIVKAAFQDVLLVKSGGVDTVARSA